MPEQHPRKRRVVAKKRAPDQQVVVEPKPRREHQKLPLDRFGFRVGSDVSIVVESMVEGGADRREVVAKALAKIGNQTTTHGKPKNISSLMSALLPQLIERGFRVESSWKLIPPPEVEPDDAPK